MPTVGTASVAQGTWFVASLTPNLGTVRTVATSASAIHPLGITALGLDACGNVQVAGTVPPPNNAGMVTVNPLRNGTSGGFYVMTLNPTATSVLFASYFGPRFSQHAHSASHAFSPAGVLYQSICTYAQVPTTANAYTRISRAGGAPSGVSLFYDLVAFKIDAAAAGTSVRAALAAVPAACAPLRTVFANTTVGSKNFRWDFGDGSTPDTARNPAHVFQAPGTYRVRLIALAGSSPCARNDTAYAVVQAKALPTVALPKIQALCPSSSLTLNANSPGHTYRWSTGATTTSINVTQPGKYVVVVSNGSCTARDSTMVRLVAPPDLPADTTGSALGGVALRAAGEPGSTYLWSTQETTASIVALTTGRYTVRVTQSGCTTEKTVNVALFRPVQPPNVITPNGDGKNDTFQLSDAAVAEPGTSLHIFTRWGQRVYTSDDYRNDWGAPRHPAGLHYYVLENPRFCVPRVAGWLEVVK